MKKINSTSKLLVSILLLWLSISIACNYPTPSPELEGISKEELRQTLDAQTVSTLQANPLPPRTTQTPGLYSFPGLQTATAAGSSGGITTRVPGGSPFNFIYYAQPGDTLTALAGRFDVELDQISAEIPLPPDAFLQPGQRLDIPNILGDTPYPAAVLPDSEIVYSPTTVDFEIHQYVADRSGYLSTYGEMVKGEWLSGSEIVLRVATETSTNPRLLLGLLEYRSGWVLGQPGEFVDENYPLGFRVPNYRGLYYELLFTATQLNIGYYGWRQGTFNELKFREGGSVRVYPALNAGSVAVQHLFAKLYKQPDWQEALYGLDRFLDLYVQMYGDPWARAAGAEPILPAGLSQPALELPFPAGERWSFTGGPHASWNAGTPLGALDFSPVTGEPTCTVSRAWVTAASAGVVTRADQNVVVLDLDGDGYEQTGWVLVHLHIAARDHVPAGTRVELDDPLGHPSCERGKNTGTHVHIARKYNGEWLPADGPIPFVLSGWQAKNGGRIYEGYLVKGDQLVSANPGGSQTSIIVR